MSLLWGIPYLLIKIALTDLHPVVIVFARCALAAALLLPIVAARRQLSGLRGRWGWVVLFAVIEIALPFTLIAAAETRLSSSLTGLLIAMVPLLAAISTRLVGLDSRIGPVRLLGLGLGLAGVALLVGVDLRGPDLVAALAVAGAAIGYTIGPLIIAMKLNTVPSVAAIGMGQAISAIVLAPWALTRWPTESVAPTSWAAVAVLGIVASAVAFIAFFALIAEVGPARASVITYVNPVIALALGVSILGEPVTLGMLVGFPLVIAGSFLATRRNPASVGGGDDILDRPPPVGHSQSTRSTSNA